MPQYGNPWLEDRRLNFERGRENRAAQTQRFLGSLDAGIAHAGQGAESVISILKQKAMEKQLAEENYFKRQEMARLQGRDAVSDSQFEKKFGADQADAEFNRSRTGKMDDWTIQHGEDTLGEQRRSSMASEGNASRGLDLRETEHGDQMGLSYDRLQDEKDARAQAENLAANQQADRDADKAEARSRADTDTQYDAAKSLFAGFAAKNQSPAMDDATAEKLGRDPLRLSAAQQGGQMAGEDFRTKQDVQGSLAALRDAKAENDTANTENKVIQDILDNMQAKGMPAGLRRNAAIYLNMAYTQNPNARPDELEAAAMKLAAAANPTRQ